MSHSVCMPVAVASADLLTAAFTGFQKSSTCMLCVNSPIQKMASRQRASSSFSCKVSPNNETPGFTAGGFFMHCLNSIFTEHAQRRSISAAQNPFFCGMKARFTIRSKSLGRATTLRLLWDCVGVLENCAMHFFEVPRERIFRHGCRCRCRINDWID